MDFVESISVPSRSNNIILCIYEEMKSAFEKHSFGFRNYFLNFASTLLFCARPSFVAFVATG